MAGLWRPRDVSASGCIKSREITIYKILVANFTTSLFLLSCGAAIIITPVLLDRGINDEKSSVNGGTDE